MRRRHRGAEKWRDLAGRPPAFCSSELEGTSVATPAIVACSTRERRASRRYVHTRQVWVALLPSVCGGLSRSSTTDRRRRFKWTTTRVRRFCLSSRRERPSISARRPVTRALPTRSSSTTRARRRPFSAPRCPRASLDIAGCDDRRHLEIPVLLEPLHRIDRLRSSIGARSWTRRRRGSATRSARIRLTNTAGPSLVPDAAARWSSRRISSEQLLHEQDGVRVHQLSR